MAKDPYKYFRIEARELLDGLTQGVLDLEKGASGADLVPHLLRLGHTLKGAARVVKQPRIAELAHAVEGTLSEHREAGQAISPPQCNELLSHLDEIGRLLGNLGNLGSFGTPGALTEATAPAAAAATSAPAAESVETLRIDVEEMDALLRGVGEAVAQLGALRARVAGIDHGGNERLLADVDRVGAALSEIHDAAHRLRLMPASMMFPSLDRTVRDAAQALDKSVELQVTGGDVRLDASVLAGLRDPLMHVVRNAVAHGIESPAERLAAGKPRTGHIRVNVERRGNRVAFTCADDGRGVDLDAVRTVAVERGALAADDARALTMSGAVALLLGGGLTTSRDVTELSGRGIGLDVVRAAAARLRGETTLRSEPGKGATVEIQVPISIASLPGLIVEAGGTRIAIPLDAVQQTLRFDDGEIARSADRDSITLDGAVLPFIPLDRALRSPAPPSRGRRKWSAIVVRSGARRVAVGVDRLLGTATVVMQSVPSVIRSDAVVAGASIDARGNPQLVLDPAGLVAEASLGRAASAAEDAPETRAPILVIDDSLTTRMLEQSILESAGYDVELAVSAEDALVKCRDRRYSMFIVDVE
ncbi:MAG TPA: ATP-binding protein, partial [Gemmatimonadaceae bacterium]|nr:ATP-binding protein [Gemmatimonadaceae bacterium]